MFIKIFQFETDDVDGLYEFFENNKLIEFTLQDETFIFKINLLKRVNENFYIIKYDFSNDFKIRDFNSVISSKSKLIYFQIDSTFYSLFSKFIHYLETILKMNNIQIKIQSLISERQKIWKFIESSYQILSLEIMTEKGIIEISEENQIDFSHFKFKLDEYPISWAHLAIKIDKISFQFHYYINEMNLPDYIDIYDLIQFFEYMEKFI